MSTVEIVMEFIKGIVVPIGICVVLPVLIVWFNMRRKNNETNRRAEIIMAAIEKNSEVNVDDYIAKMTPKQPSFREKLLRRLHLELLWGTVLLVLGTVWLVFAIIALAVPQYHGFQEVVFPFSTAGIPCMAAGVGLFVAYRCGRKQLAGLKDTED